MQYLIVNADDFGLTLGVTRGIIEASEFGIVRSTSMLANTDHFDAAVSLLKKSKKLGVGVHLNLSQGRPVSSGVPSLVNKDGSFYKRAEMVMHLKSLETSQIEMEFEAQIGKIKNAGINITHLDSHYQIHKLPKINEVVVSLAKKYGFAIRKTDIPCPGVRTTECFTDKFHGDATSEMHFKMLIKKYHRADSLELMCHPGFCDLELMNKAEYAKKRDVELSVLSKYSLQAYVERNGTELINFGELTCL